jgi:predicted acylesterase/phospholipase RssA
MAVPETEFEAEGERPTREEDRVGALWSVEPALAERGRLGLALSGGGFRAAFFHLGVLAQMARLGLLHQVEVISTVSGGSVIGALYYLHLRELLQAKPDGQIDPEDYTRLLLRLERDFTAAVQRNLRTRTFANPLKNLWMSLSPRYSRSDRVGELYDRYFYRPAVKSDLPVRMRDLKIQPPEGPDPFHPLEHNGPRQNKVPILLINSAALNTGHNWRFEAVRMGSPPRRQPAAREVDRTVRLCRPDSYEELPEHQRDFALGTAVAASTGVPGFFPPVAVSGVYEDVRVQLVDGGLHDNQGVGGLLDMDCERFVVSDAGGQLEFAPEPSSGLLGVAVRSNGVLMQRVRDEQLFRLMERHAPTAFVHLRRGLPIEVRPWIGPDGASVEREECRPWSDENSSEFGVDARVQEHLADIRTDLDSFSETESATLAYDGYRMSEPRLRLLAGEEPSGADEDAGYGFLAAAGPALTPPDGYLRHLKVGRQRFGKALALSAPVKWAAVALALAAFVALVVALWAADVPLPRLPLGPVLLGIAALAFLVAVPQMNMATRPVRRAAELLLGVIRGLLMAAASLLVWLHLLTLDRLFLRLGRLDRWTAGRVDDRPSGVASKR